MNDRSLATLEDRLEEARVHVAPALNRYYCGYSDALDHINGAMFPQNLKDTLKLIVELHIDALPRKSGRRSVSHNYSMVWLAHELLSENTERERKEKEEIKGDALFYNLPKHGFDWEYKRFERASKIYREHIDYFVTAFVLSNHEKPPEGMERETERLQRGAVMLQAIKYWHVSSNVSVLMLSKIADALETSYLKGEDDAAAESERIGHLSEILLMTERFKSHVPASFIETARYICKETANRYHLSFEKVERRKEGDSRFFEEHIQMMGKMANMHIIRATGLLKN